MTVQLYTFSKKDNSTAKPSGAGTQFSCVLKDSSGILAPSLEFGAGIGNPRSYNYAYISDYGRYYYVDDWTYYRGTWSASLRVDALASWKSYIGGASHYILRAADDAAWNPWVIDNKYPIIEPGRCIGNSATAPLYTNECIVLGIIGDSSHGNNRGAVNYYALTPTQSKTFFQFLMGNTGGYMDALDALFSYTFDEVFRASFDPFQYIVSARWFPVLPINYISQTAVIVGKLPISVSPAIADTRLLPADAMEILGPFTITIPKHPQIPTRGDYLSAPPYSQYVLEVQPFGRIPIDGSLLCGYTTLSGYVYVDMITGKSLLVVEASNTGGSAHVGSWPGQIGVDVQIAQITSNFIDNVANQLGNAIEAGMSENYFGVAQAAIGTITDTRYQLSSSGCNGSNLPYILYNPMLELYYHDVAAADVDHLGRPCCRVNTISSYAGYMICADGDVAAPATQPELDTIRAALTSGFYYE